MFQTCESCFSTELSQQPGGGTICLNCGYSNMFEVERFDSNNLNNNPLVQFKKLSAGFSNHILPSTSSLNTQGSQTNIEDQSMFPEHYDCTFKQNRLILDLYQHVLNLFVNWINDKISINRILLKNFMKQIWFLFLDKWSANGWSNRYNNSIKIDFGGGNILNQNKEALSLYFNIDPIKRTVNASCNNGTSHNDHYNLKVSAISTSTILAMLLTVCDFFGISFATKRQICQFIVDNKSKFPLFNFQAIVNDYFNSAFEKAMTNKQKPMPLELNEIQSNDNIEDIEFFKQKERLIYNSVRDMIIKFNVIPKPTQCGLAMYIKRRSCKFQKAIIHNIKNRHKHDIFIRISVFNLFKRLKLTPNFIQSFFRFYTSLKSRVSLEIKPGLYAWFCCFLLFYLNYYPNTWFSGFKVKGSVLEGFKGGPSTLVNAMREKLLNQDIFSNKSKNIYNVYQKKCERIQSIMNRKRTGNERFEIMYGKLKELFTIFDQISVNKIDKCILKKLFISINRT